MGQLVYVGSPHEIAKGKLAWIIFGGLLGVGSCIDVHASEFIACKWFPRKPCALLFKENGARALHFNANGNDGSNEQEKKAGYAGTDNIEKALENAVVSIA